MIPAKYIMCKKAAVNKATTGREIVYKMMGIGCPGLPVVDEGSEVIGVVTMCDILKATHDRGAKMDEINAEQVMSHVPATAGPDTSREDLAKMMIENNYSFIPIVKGKKLLGIVSGREVVETYVEPQLYTVFEE